jgi:hypothetical protein
MRLNLMGPIMAKDNTLTPNSPTSYSPMHWQRGSISQGVCVCAADPGGAATNFARNNGILYWAKHGLSYLLWGMLRTFEEGGDMIVYLASSEGISSGFFRDRMMIRSSDNSYNKDLQMELWSSSQRRNGLGL